MENKLIKFEIEYWQGAAKRIEKFSIDVSNVDAVLRTEMELKSRVIMKSGAEIIINCPYENLWRAILEKISPDL